MLIAHKIALDLNNAQARPGVPDRLHPAHGAGAGPATFRDPRGPRGLCGNGAECESPRSRSLLLIRLFQQAPRCWGGGHRVLSRSRARRMWA